MKIGKTNDMTQSYFRAVLYGLAGSGKTRSVLTLVKSGFSPIVVEAVPFEDGCLSISDTPIDLIKISAATEKGMTAEMRERGYCSFAELLASAESLPNDVLYIEGLTAISKLYLAEAKKESNNIWDIYSKVAENLTQMLLKLKSIKKNVIFTALPDVIKTPSELEVYTPLVDGQAFPRTLPSLIDGMLYLHANGKGERSIITRYNGKCVAKLRYAGSTQIDLEIPADLGQLLIKLGFKPGKESK